MLDLHPNVAGDDADLADDRLRHKGSKPVKFRMDDTKMTHGKHNKVALRDTHWEPRIATSPATVPDTRPLRTNTSRIGFNRLSWSGPRKQ